MRVWLALVVLVVAALLNNVVVTDAYVLTCVAATACLVLLAHLDGLTRTDVGLGPASLRVGAAWGVALTGIVVAGYLLVLAVPAMRTALVDDRAAQLSTAGLFWQAMVRVPLGTVLLEEVAFRGVLWAMIARRRGVWWATGASSALFGLWHVAPALRLTDVNAAAATVFGTAPLGQWLSIAAATVGTAVAGAIFCELRRRSGSLLTPAVLHWALNAGGYFFSWTAARLWAE